MRTAKTLIRLGGCPGWSESSLGAHAILVIWCENMPKILCRFFCVFFLRFEVYFCFWLVMAQNLRFSVAVCCKIHWWCAGSFTRHAVWKVIVITFWKIVIQWRAKSMSQFSKFPLTYMYFSVCKKIDNFISTHPVSMEIILMESEITGTLDTHICCVHCFSDTKITAL